MDHKKLTVEEVMQNPEAGAVIEVNTSSLWRIRLILLLMRIVQWLAK